MQARPHNFEKVMYLLFPMITLGAFYAALLLYPVCRNVVFPYVAKSFGLTL